MYACKHAPMYFKSLIAMPHNLYISDAKAPIFHKKEKIKLPFTKTLLFKLKKKIKDLM